jgi:hypothetical protein
MLIFCARNCGCCLLIESLLVVPNMSDFFYALRLESCRIS